jgi:hypothetical protein
MAPAGGANSPLSSGKSARWFLRTASSALWKTDLCSLVARLSRVESDRLLAFSTLNSKMPPACWGWGEWLSRRTEGDIYQVRFIAFQRLTEAVERVGQNPLPHGQGACLSPELSSKRYLQPGLLNPGRMSKEPSGCTLMATRIFSCSFPSGMVSSARSAMMYITR